MTTSVMINLLDFFCLILCKDHILEASLCPLMDDYLGMTNPAMWFIILSGCRDYGMLTTFLVY